jgi:hypothetical protein
MVIKKEVLNFLDIVKYDVDINLRTFIMVTKMCNSFPKNWRNLATYSIRQ